MLASFDQTAILVRCPGSRAHALISTTPSLISGTSISKRRLMRPGWVRLTTIWGPLAVLRTSMMYAFSRLFGSGRSCGTCSACGSSASTRPRSSNVYRASLCWMMPLTMSPSRPAYSAYLVSRSTSRRRWVMTWRVVCAAMRPKLSGVTSSSGPTGSPSSSRSARQHADVEGLGVDGDPRELAGVGHLLVGALERVGQGAHEGLGGNALVGREGLERFHHLRVATSHDAAFFSGAGRVGRVARAALALPGFGAGSQSNTVRACWMSE